MRARLRQAAWKACALTRLADADGAQAGQTVVHAYGAPTVALQSQLSSIQASAGTRARTRAQRPAERAPQVGTAVPPDKRLKFAAELFDVVDVDGERQLNATKLQARSSARNTLARMLTPAADCFAGAGAAAPPERRAEALC